MSSLDSSPNTSNSATDLDTMTFSTSDPKFAPHVPPELRTDAVSFEIKNILASEQALGFTTNLDNVRSNATLERLLDVPKRQLKGLIKALVSDKWLCADIPDGHSLMRGEQASFYFNKTILEQTQVDQNFRAWIRFAQNKGEFLDLDRLTENEIIASILGIKTGRSTSMYKLAREFVDRGLMSAHMSDFHSISPVQYGAKRSLYVREEAVRDNAKERNVKRWVQMRYTYPEDVKTHSESIWVLGKVLEAGQSVTKMRELLLKRGWLIPAAPEFGLTELPEAFRPKPLPRLRPDQRAQRGLTVEIQENPNYEINFLKGEAFEQLVGLTLAIKYGNEKLWPQYCLLIDEKNGHYGMRVDWRVGKDLWEVKFGGDAHNIRETYAAHLALIPPGFNYNVVTLLDVHVPGVPTGTFAAMVSDLPESNNFLGVANRIAELRGEDPNDRLALSLLRDYLFTISSVLNISPSTKRSADISAALKLIVQCPSEQLGATLLSTEPRAFSPLVATFEHEGVMYRGRLQMPTYLKEAQRTDLKLIYGFGGLRFSQIEDRDIAVMLELSQEFIDAKWRAEQSLRCDPESRAIHENPVFHLPNGLTFSRKEIANLSDIRNHVDISDDLYEFGLKYLASFGELA